MVISTFAALCGLCNVGGLNFPQLAFVVSLGAVAVLAYKADWLTGAFSWLQRGHHVGRAVPLSLAAVALTAVGLVSWHSILKPDNSTIYTQFGFLSLPLPVLVSGAIAFALLNAAIEEAVYRGLLMDALNEQFPLPVAVGLQASAFGMLHMLGFPGGAIGIVLATVYGAMMAAVRLYSGGMLAPWAAHVTADLTIFTILLVALHR
jgi:membrane protease YdiL (CAAX protease family)